MANNPYLNKVVYGNNTVMDISDSDVAESDVASGKVFYKGSGQRSVGTANMDSAVWGNITGTLSDQSDLNTELNRKFGTNDTLVSTITDSDAIPYSTPQGVKALISFSKIKQLVSSAFRKLLKDTVGWVSNNIADMSKGASNPTSARVIVPCEPSTTYYASASGLNPFTNVGYTRSGQSVVMGGDLPFTVTSLAATEYFIFEFKKSSAVTQSDIDSLKFMVSETQNDTYEPYHASVEDYMLPQSVQNVMGAKNLLPLKIANIKSANSSGSWSDNVYTLNGVTYTFSVDDAGYVNEINVNGTASAFNGLLLENWTENNLVKDSDVFFSGCAVNGSSLSYRTAIQFNTSKSDTGATTYMDLGEGVTVPTSSIVNPYYKVSLNINSNTVMSNVKFKPMLRLTSYSDDTYQPYAMTNRELTEKKDSFTASVVQANDKVVFDNLDASYGYELWWDDRGAYFDLDDSAKPYPTHTKKEAGTTTGTIKLTFTIEGGTNGSSYFALRILK